jgi:predicted DNA-binding protein
MLVATKGDLGMSNKLEQIAVRLEPELREKLQLAADQDRRPLAGLIRKILHDHASQRQTGAAA